MFTSLYNLSSLLKSQKSFVVLIGLVVCTFFVAEAAPSPLILKRNILQSEFNPSQFRLYYVDSIPRQFHQDAKPDKRYDRNCFFSPVQCMLSYNANANDPIYHPSGR